MHLKNFVFICATLLLLLLCIFPVSISAKHHRRHRHGSPQSQSREESLPYKRNPNYECVEDEEDLQYFKDKAETKCKCPKMYAPVCGTDGITYHNRCFIQCAVREKYKGFLKNGRRLTIAKMEPCDGDL